MGNLETDLEKRIVGSFWPIFFGGIMIISVAGGAFSRTVLNRPNFGYYINYILWISLWAVYILKEKKYCFSKKYYLIFGLVLFNAIVGAFLGSHVLQMRTDNFHQAFLTGMVILIVMGVDWNTCLKKEDILIIMKVIFYIGITAAVYAMIIQSRNWVGVLLGKERSVNAWVYRSFFGQRNVFAYFCFLSSVAGMYLLSMTQKKRYLFGMALLALQIYVTDSRTAMLALLLFYALCIYLSLGKIGKIIWLLVGLCAATGILLSVDVFELTGRFYHESHTGFGDSGSLRLHMWDSGTRYLFSNYAALTGFGFDSQGPYLAPRFQFSSFHNAYMDIFFQGGAVLLGIHLYLIVEILKSVLKTGKQRYQYISLAFIAAFLFGCLFDSSAMLFSSNYEAVLSTVMIGILTRIEMSE